MKRKELYNLFQINLILLIVSAISLTPTITVVSFIFDLHHIFAEDTIILISFLIAAGTSGSAAIYIILTRDYLQRTVKVTYTKEFSILLVLSTFGVLGIGVIYIYLGGPLAYVPHIIIPAFITAYSTIFYVGDRYFNVKLLSK